MPGRLRSQAKESSLQHEGIGTSQCRLGPCLAHLNTHIIIIIIVVVVFFFLKKKKEKQFRLAQGEMINSLFTHISYSTNPQLISVSFKAYIRVVKYLPKI